MLSLMTLGRSDGWPGYLFEEKAADFQAEKVKDIEVSSDIDGLTFLSVASFEWIKPMLPVILHLQGQFKLTQPLAEIKGLDKYFDAAHGLRSLAFRISFIRDLPIFLGITWMEEHDDINWTSVFLKYMLKNIFLPATHLLPVESITYKTYAAFQDNMVGLPSMIKIYSEDWPLFSENVKVLIGQEKRRLDSLLYMCNDVFFFTTIHGMKHNVADLNFVSYLSETIDFNLVQFKSIHICQEISSKSKSVLAFTRKFLRTFGENASLYPVFGSHEFANMSLSIIPTSIYNTYGQNINWRNYTLHYIQAYQNANKTVSGIGINRLFEGSPASQLMRMYGEHLRYELKNSKRFKENIEPILKHHDYKRAIEWAKDLENGTSVRFEIVIQLHTSNLQETIRLFTDPSHLQNFLELYTTGDITPIVEIDEYFLSKYMTNTITNLYSPVMLAVDRIHDNIDNEIPYLTQDISVADIITTLFAESCINYLVYGLRTKLPNKLLLSEGVGITRQTSSYKYNRIIIPERHRDQMNSTYQISDLHYDSSAGYHEYIGTIMTKPNVQRRVTAYIIKMMELIQSNEIIPAIEGICLLLMKVLQCDIHECGSSAGYKTMYQNPSHCTSEMILRHERATEIGIVSFRDYIHKVICGTINADVVFPLGFALPSCIEKTISALQIHCGYVDLPNTLSTKLDSLNTFNCENNIQPRIEVVPKQGAKHVVTRWNQFSRVEGSTPMDMIQDRVLHQ